MRCDSGAPPVAHVSKHASVCCFPCMLIFVPCAAPSCARVAVEARESLEELTSTAVAELLEAARDNRHKLAAVQRDLAESYSAGDMTAMRRHTIRLSFLNNIEEEIYKRMPVQ